MQITKNNHAPDLFVGKPNLQSKNLEISCYFLNFTFNIFQGCLIHRNF